MFAASHIGRDHQRVGRNNQDGVFSSARVVVVTDGCSSQPQSEVGAQLGARFLGQWLSAQPEVTTDLPQRATQALTAYLARAIEPFGDDRAAVLERAFLFTFLAAAHDGQRALVFGVGDGAFLVDDALVRLDAGEDNAPPYCAYRLTGSSQPVEPQLHFIGAARRLAVMTDGLQPLAPTRVLALVDDVPGLRRNPLTLQRRLNVLADAERLADDATLALVEG
jgi:hypothetical protein